MTNDVDHVICDNWLVFVWNRKYSLHVWWSGLLGLLGWDSSWVSWSGWSESGSDTQWSTCIQATLSCALFSACQHWSGVRRRPQQCQTVMKQQQRLWQQQQQQPQQQYLRPQHQGNRLLHPRVTIYFFSPTTTTILITTTVIETTTEEITTLVDTTTLLYDQYEEYDEDQNSQRSGSLPLWIIVLLCIIFLLLLSLATLLYIKKYQPELWSTIRTKLPVMSRQNFYQVSPLTSCSQYNVNVISNCLPSKPLRSIFNLARWRQPRQEPSRDTCFLCMNKVCNYILSERNPIW